MVTEILSDAGFEAGFADQQSAPGDYRGLLIREN